MVEDELLVEQGGMGDDGDGFEIVIGIDGGLGGELEGQDVFNGEGKGGEDAVEAFKAEGAAAVEEIGDMGLLEADLTGKLGTGERAFFDPAENLETEKFM